MVYIEWKDCDMFKKNIVLNFMVIVEELISDVNFTFMLNVKISQKPFSKNIHRSPLSSWRMGTLILLQATAKTFTPLTFAENDENVCLVT